MKNAFWTYWLILLGIFIVVIMLLVQSVTSNNQQDYFLVKELTEAAMVDAVDYAYYRQFGEIRMNKEKFYESFIRRFAENASLNNTYEISFYGVYEAPPKASVEVKGKSATFNVVGDSTEFDIVNRIDAILEGDAISDNYGSSNNSSSNLNSGSSSGSNSSTSNGSSGNSGSSSSNGNSGSSSSSGSTYRNWTNADINIDTNNDGKPDVNIDTNSDGIPDIEIDTDNDGKSDINLDTDGDGKPDTNLDTNDDGKPDINVDNHDREAKWNVQKNSNSIKNTTYGIMPVANIKIADIKLKNPKDQDNNGDGICDMNCDTNQDGWPDVNLDTNGDGKCDLNCTNLALAKLVTLQTINVTSNSIQARVNAPTTLDNGSKITKYEFAAGYLSWKVSSTGATYTFSDLLAYGLYNIRARITYSDGTGIYSPILGVTTNKVKPTVTAEIRNVGTDSFTVIATGESKNYGKTTNRVKLTKFEYSLNNGEWVEGNNTTNPNTYKFNKLNANTEYNIRVRVTDSIGEVSEIVSINQKTENKVQTNTNTSTDNSKPSGEIEVTSVGTNYINIKVTGRASSSNYKITKFQYRINGGSWKNGANANNPNSMSFNNLKANTEYTIEVKLTDGLKKEITISKKVKTNPETDKQTLAQDTASSCLKDSRNMQTNSLSGMKGTSMVTGNNSIMWEDLTKKSSITKVVPGIVFEILGVDDHGNWAIKYDNKCGWVNNTYMAINLKDYIPELSFNITNASSSIYKSSDEKLDVYGKRLYSTSYSSFVPATWPFAKKLKSAVNSANKDGYKLVVYDAYRPRSVSGIAKESLLRLINKFGGQNSSNKIWSNMNKYGYNTSYFLSYGVSAHNTACAVDIAFTNSYNEATGMPSDMHELSVEAAKYATNGSSTFSTAMKNSKMAQKLHEYMMGAGLNELSSEWWHYQLTSCHTNIKNGGAASGADFWSNVKCSGSGYTNCKVN